MFNRLAANTVSNVAVLAVKLALTFILTPLIVRSLGNYDYGIWQIIISFVGYMGVLDLGLRPTVSRYIAKYSASQNHQKMQEAYSTALVLLSVTGIVASIVFALWAFFEPSLLSINNDDVAKYKWLLLIVSIQLLFAFPGYAAESVLEGMQKFYIKNLIVIVNSLIGAAILWMIIDNENGLIILALLNGIGGTAKYLIFTLLIRNHNYGSLRISPVFARKKVMKELTIFGGKSLIQGAADRIESNTDTLIIAALIGPAAIITYAIPEALIRQMKMLTHSVTLAFMPLLSGLLAKGELERSRFIFVSASKMTVALALLGATGIFVLGYPFIYLWIGQDLGRNAEFVVIILTFYLLLPLMNPLDSRLLTALNRHGILAKIYPVSAVANVALSIALAKTYGVIGVALGSLIPVIVVVPIVLKATCRAIGINVSYYLRACVASSLAPAATAGLTMTYFRFSWGTDSFLKIFALAALGTLIYSISFWVFAINKNEKTLIYNSARAMFRQTKSGEAT